MTKIIKAVNFTRTISPQAVMASDFAISRFKYIVRLLLVHGHWNYDRLARMILYFFYKNATFVFAYFWFQVRIQAVILNEVGLSRPCDSIPALLRLLWRRHDRPDVPHALQPPLHFAATRRHR